MDANGAVTLGTVEEARRLWNGAQAAFGRDDQDVTALGEALDLGSRTAELLAVDRLRPVRDRFPASIGALLDAPPPDVSAHRDAVEVPKSLEFTEVLDLLSDEALECVGPELHRGWEDRRALPALVSLVGGLRR